MLLDECTRVDTPLEKARATLFINRFYNFTGKGNADPHPRLHLGRLLEGQVQPHRRCNRCGHGPRWLPELRHALLHHPIQNTGLFQSDAALFDQQVGHQICVRISGLQQALNLGLRGR
ncbi:hypothetical protein NL676_002599 [Syzygium grande]|nr:hypothetical protein NL676_002599 [Syzygium grande]